MDAAREGTMNEHTPDTEIEARPAKARPARVGAFRTIPEVRDLVIDLSGYLELDVTLLGMLLTAREKAAEEGKAVWLAGLHVQLWQALHAMGLARLFRPFPASEEAAV